MLREEGIEELEVYIGQSYNTMAELISTVPIIKLCLESDRLPGAGSQNGGESRMACG